ncbi:MAG: hypothetical protein CM1200mP41_26770 [Gammaproteobacteria bacterium]|nr:MAG: hypothetical protein CM1200mP41_26770 [Gammaproteobacteria bacterium]
MAVEAARNTLSPQQYAQIDGLYLASTSLPFQDRQNAGIAAEAMHLGNDLQTMDITGSQRAGTSALLTALQIAVGNTEYVSHRWRKTSGQSREPTATDFWGWRGCPVSRAWRGCRHTNGLRRTKRRFR